MEERELKGTEQTIAGREGGKANVPRMGMLKQQLEGALARAEAAEKELQSFAYTVSHDLRAPLRAIEGFSKILLEDFSAKLPEDVREFLDHIIANAQLLTSQLDDLLVFYRLGKNPPAKVVFNPRNVIEEIWKQTREKYPERKLDLHMEQIREVSADPNLLRHVFAHLLDNAIKFSRNRPQSVIKVGSRETARNVEFFVSDDGIGFDQQYVSRLFQVFQKLHPPSEYPGNGIGLAVTRRIIEAHQGRVWGEGTSGKGATFYFSIPK
jgi:light-regulated signal transduction histidine kinase (bacteriophytochrome)